MTDSVQPAPADPERQNPEATLGGHARGAAAGTPHPQGMMLPQLTARRQRDIDIISILIGFMLLGLALILTLALTGWIQTPWQTFPAGAGGVDFRYALEDAFSIGVGMPAAVAVIVIGHVALFLLRRIPARHPDRAGPGRVIATALVAVCLATAYLALAMQVFYAVTYFRRL